jgi:hypothetical protein
MPDRHRDAPRGGSRVPSDQTPPRYEGRETRSFGEEGRFSSDQARYYGADSRSYAPRHEPDPAAGDRAPWRRERYGARGDEDHGVYGSGYDPGGGYGRDEDHGYRSFDGDFHGGQEYGVSASGRGSPRYAQQSYADNRGDDLGYESRRRGVREDPAFRNAPYGDQPLPHDPGARAFGPPADYAYHPNPDRDLEPDYVAWRDAQLRDHDRDYAGWRAEQHRRYDEHYRAFRGERRETFGKTFADWRAQRDAVARELDQAPGITNGGETPDDKV